MRSGMSAGLARFSQARRSPHRALEDAKFEFGLAEDGTCILIDGVLAGLGKVLARAPARRGTPQTQNRRTSAGAAAGTASAATAMGRGHSRRTGVLAARRYLLYGLIQADGDFQAASAAVDQPAVLAEPVAFGVSVAC